MTTPLFSGKISFKLTVFEEKFSRAVSPKDPEYTGGLVGGAPQKQLQI